MATRVPRAKADPPAVEAAAPAESSPRPTGSGGRRPLPRAVRSSSVAGPGQDSETAAVKAVRAARANARAAATTPAPARASRTVRVRPDADLARGPGGAGDGEAPENYAAGTDVDATDDDPVLVDTEADGPEATESQAGDSDTDKPAPTPRAVRPPAPPALDRPPAPPAPARRTGPPPNRPPAPPAPPAPAAEVRDFPAGAKGKDAPAEAPKEKKQRRSVQTVLTAGFKDVLNKVGTVAQLVGLVCAAILVVYVLLVASDANAGNAIYRWFMHRSNNDLVYGFKTLFKLKTAHHTIEANYLTAAAVYLAAGAIIKRVLSRIAG